MTLNPVIHRLVPVALVKSGVYGWPEGCQEVVVNLRRNIAKSDRKYLAYGGPVEFKESHFF